MGKGRHATARMPEIVETIASNITSISREANSAIRTTTTQGFSRKFAKKSSERQKIYEERLKRVKIPHFLSDRFQ